MKDSIEFDIKKLNEAQKYELRAKISGWVFQTEKFVEYFMKDAQNI